VKGTCRAAIAGDCGLPYELTTRITARTHSAPHYGQSMSAPRCCACKARWQGIAANYPRAARQIILVDETPAGWLAISCTDGEIRAGFRRSGGDEAQHFMEWTPMQQLAE